MVLCTALLVSDCGGGIVRASASRSPLRKPAVCAQCSGAGNLWQGIGDELLAVQQAHAAELQVKEHQTAQKLAALRATHAAELAMVQSAQRSTSRSRSPQRGQAELALVTSEKDRLRIELRRVVAENEDLKSQLSDSLERQMSNDLAYAAMHEEHAVKAARTRNEGRRVTSQFAATRMTEALSEVLKDDLNSFF